MAGTTETSTYRIERRPAGVLHLYRDDELVDVDREIDGDSLEDIERWGSGVAWAEDHTGIERWEPDEVGDQWRVLTGIAYRYVACRHEEEGVTAWEELDSANWAARYIEAKDHGQVYLAAGSLREVISARDTGGIKAVQAYEQVYGVVPEAPFPADAEQLLTPISAREFVERWSAARRELEMRHTMLD